MAGEIDIREIDPQNLYTLGQTAHFLRVAYGTVLKFRKNGAFPSRQIGKKWYIEGAEIINFIKIGPPNTPQALRSDERKGSSEG